MPDKANPETIWSMSMISKSEYDIGTSPPKKNLVAIRSNGELHTSQLNK